MELSDDAKRYSPAPLFGTDVVAEYYHGATIRTPQREGLVLYRSTAPSIVAVRQREFFRSIASMQMTIRISQREFRYS